MSKTVGMGVKPKKADGSEGLKALEKENEELKNKVDTLEKGNKSLKKKVDALEKENEELKAAQEKKGE